MADTPSILIIACDPYLAGIYARKFEKDGWVTEVVENLEEGERKSSKMRPDIILLDNGCTVDVSAEVKRIKALPTILKSKIVILTKAGDREEIERVRKAGASDYLIFGHFVPQEAVQKMRKLLQSK